MSKFPVKINRRPARVVREDEAEIVEQPTTPFVSFSYTFAEVSVRDGKARVRSRKTQLADGRVTSESFEGELDRSSYDDAIAKAHRHAATQTAMVFDMFSALLPFRPRR